MKVTEKDVAYVADLANLELSEQERTRMVRDLNSILDYIETLNELDTTDVPPMDRSLAEAYSGRDDILHGLRKSLPQEVALEGAPESDGKFFEVPKVIER